MTPKQAVELLMCHFVSMYSDFCLQLIQRRCQRCQGSGLVRKKRYRSEMDVRKCPDCGGFFPWQGWKQFLTSTAAPGNGGPLQQPKGQNSIFYRCKLQLKTYVPQNRRLHL